MGAPTNTPADEERVIVTQADREAAAAAGTLVGRYVAVENAQIRLGQLDDDPLVKAFARHRLASRPTLPEGMVEDWLRGDWYEKWQDATENADDGLMATLEALKGRVENTILAALSATPAPSETSGENIPAGMEKLADALDSGTWADVIIELETVVGTGEVELELAASQKTIARWKNGGRLRPLTEKLLRRSLREYLGLAALSPTAETSDRDGALEEAGK